MKRLLEKAKNMQAILSIQSVMLDKSFQCFYHHSRGLLSMDKPFQIFFGTLVRHFYANPHRGYAPFSCFIFTVSIQTFVGLGCGK